MRGIREGWTRHPWEWLLLLAAAALLVAMAAAPRAHGLYHLMKISEVHFDTVGGTDNDFIELQMYTGGQTQVGGHYIRIYTDTGSPQTEFMIPGDVLNGESQRTILIGNTTALGADFNDNTVDPDPDGGAVCFLDNLGTPDDATGRDVGIDCVAWGTFGGTFEDGIPSPVGTVLPAPGGFADETSIARSIAPGCPTLLEATDDTDNSATDFAVATPSPRNNAGAITEMPCAPPPSPVKCGGKNATKTGTAGANVLVGTAGKDVIAGLGGNDTVRGLAGNDILCGGGGRDRLIGGGGRDKLFGQAGRDICRGGPKRDTAKTCETKRTI